MGTNELDIKQRAARGKRVEREIIDTLNAHGPMQVGRFNIRNQGWFPANKRDDMTNKVDAWASLLGRGPGNASVQIKYRESGQDLGLALVRPYHGVLKLAEDWANDRLAWDRDVTHPVGLYVVKVPGMGLVIVEAAPVKEAAISLLEEMADEPDFSANVFRSDPEGIELRIVVDKGAGYSQGQRKVIAYMTPRFLVKLGGKVVQDGR